MGSKGWIKLHRRIQDHWIYQEERTFSKYEAWLDLIMMANHQDDKVLIDNELLTVKRGQFITSIRKLCQRWKWSNTKVKSFLELLKTDGMIIYKSDRKKTAVAIVNYDVYHEKDSEKHHENDSDEFKNQEKSDAENTPPTLDPQRLEVEEESKKHHKNDAKTHKQECKELKRKEEEERDPVVACLIDNNVIHENGIPQTLLGDIVDVEQNFGFENPNEMMIEAIKDSVRGNGKTWKFVYNKLNNWRAQGIKNKQQLYGIQAKQFNNTIPFRPKKKKEAPDDGYNYGF